MATTGATQTGSRDQRSGSGYLLPADAGFEASGLPGLRKAAILIMGVGDDVAKILLSRLNESDVQRVTDEITRLGACRQARSHRS